MESLHGLMTAHWDHELTPNPSQEGTGQDADEYLLPSWEGSGVGRFMESLLSLSRMHWDHEPRRAGRWPASVLDCGSPLPLLRPRTRSESARGLAHSKTSRCAGWFMERGRVRADGPSAPVFLVSGSVSAASRLSGSAGKLKQ